jgi:FAD/FMN-containing dehydrogenase
VKTNDAVGGLQAARHVDAERNPPLPAYASRLARDLGRAVAGEVDFGAQARALYAFDASVFRQVPVGVVVPRDAADVEAALACCREHGAPVLGRGCGTGLAGQTVNQAVVFDFSRYMNAVVELDPRRRQARVQPGVICDELKDAAEPHRLTFGPDPATHDHATLGGMIGNNSCGTHSVLSALYGPGPRTSDNVDELDILTYDGLRLRVGATSEEDLAAIIAGGGRRAEIYAGLKRIADTYGDAIRAGLPDIPRRVSGYNLDELLPEKGFNVARALVGSEGTCALVLEATTRLVHSPPERSLVVLGYPDIPSSGDDVPWLMGFEPIGCEFTSRHVVDNLHAKGFDFGGEDRLPPGDAWVLLVRRRHQGRGRCQSRRAVPAARKALGRAEPPAVREPGGRERGLGGAPSLGRHRPDAGRTGRPRRLAELGGRRRPARPARWLPARLYGPAGPARIRRRLLRALGPGLRALPHRLGFPHRRRTAQLPALHGGSRRPGGLLRRLAVRRAWRRARPAELWPKMFGTDLLRAFAEFKAVWDPENKLNPHKLVDPYPLDSHLREGPGYRPLPLVTKFAYPQDGGSFHEAAGRCFGVGKCRHVDGGVMCPSFMVTREEKHSTRGRARLLQEMAEASGPVKDRWRSEEVKDALDLCLACKGCKGDCPVKVDMATIPRARAAR